MANPELKLYLDTVSPFAYLAFHVVMTSPVFKDCEITYVPVLLRGIMEASGNTPPTRVKNKAQWMRRMRIHWANFFNVPMNEKMPEGFPQNSLQTQRALCAVALSFPTRLEEILAALFHSSFFELKAIHTPDGLHSALTAVFGPSEANEILTKSNSDEVKDLLSANTDEALTEGSFGLPWYAATNREGQKECFWGFDYLAQVADHLGLERPIPGSADEGGWRKLL